MVVKEDQIVQMIRHVLREYVPEQKAIRIPAEVSGRHVHLSCAHIDALFGKEYVLTEKRALSQTGQFLAHERVTIFTPQGQLENVAVLGPMRSETQVELSKTDARQLGLNPPVNISGDRNGSEDIYIMSEHGVVKAERSVIVAANHIHMTKADAENFGLADRDRVMVSMNTERPLVFQNVLVRVSDDHRLMFHMDTDEANACAYEEGMCATIVGRTQNQPKMQTLAPEEKLITAKRAGELVKAATGGGIIQETNHKHARKKIPIKKGVIVTPLAKDIFRDAGMEIEYI